MSIDRLSSPPQHPLHRHAGASALHPSPKTKATNGETGGYVVPLSLAATATNQVAHELKSRTEWQLKQNSPSVLMNLFDRSQTLNQTFAQKTQELAPALAKLGNAPTLSEILGIGDDLADLSTIKATGGKAWVDQVGKNFAGAFKGNAYTQGLTGWQLLSQPANWSQAPKVLGRTLHAGFTRPITEALAGTGNVIGGGLTTLALGGMAFDIGASTVKANTKAREAEDGTWGSKADTLAETTGTFARKTLKHGAGWFAGSVGFTVGKALGVGLKGLGPAANILGVATGIAAGALAGGTTSAVLNTLLPEPEEA
jgi:hypothetical protein